VNALLLSAICVSIRSSVILVIHTQTTQHIEMFFAPYDRAMFMHAFLAVAKLLVVLISRRGFVLVDIEHRSSACSTKSIFHLDQYDFAFSLSWSNRC